MGRVASADIFGEWKVNADGTQLEGSWEDFSWRAFGSMESYENQMIVKGTVETDVNGLRTTSIAI